MDAHSGATERRMIMLFADIDEIIDCTPSEKPQTNADRIRAMSDEELADLTIREIGYCAPTGDCEKTSNDCKACWLDWLKQPVEEGTV